MKLILMGSGERGLGAWTSCDEMLLRHMYSLGLWMSAAILMLSIVLSTRDLTKSGTFRWMQLHKGSAQYGSEQEVVCLSCKMRSQHKSSKTSERIMALS